MENQVGSQIGITIVFLITFLLLLTFNELAYRRLGLKGEYTRKLAHFAATLSTLIFPFIFNNHWHVLGLAIIFFILLFISRNTRHLKSIHDIKRVSAGSFLLPVAIYLTFLVSHLLDNKFLFILPILVLAICDPVAGILGMNHQINNRKIRIFKKTLNKTWLGSISFLVSCYLVSIIALYYNNQMSFNPEIFLLALIIALTGTLAEMFSWKGTDNLFIPMSVLLVLVLFY